MRNKKSMKYEKYEEVQYNDGVFTPNVRPLFQVVAQAKSVIVYIQVTCATSWCGGQTSRFCETIQSAQQNMRLLTQTSQSLFPPCRCFFLIIIFFKCNILWVSVLQLQSMFHTWETYSVYSQGFGMNIPQSLLLLKVLMAKSNKKIRYNVPQTWAANVKLISTLKSQLESWYFISI